MLENTVRGSLHAIEKALGLQPGFLENLHSQDDWSFIVKAHALVEAAISHLLCRALGRDELADVFANMELSGKTSGKIAFVKALSLLEEPDRRFINSLSELRNHLVHNVLKVQFDLQQYTGTMPPDQFASFAKKFNSFSNGERVEYQGKSLPPEEVFRQDAKTGILWSTMVTVAIIYQVREMEQFRKEAERLSFIKSTLSRLFSGTSNE